MSNDFAELEGSRWSRWRDRSSVGSVTPVDEKLAGLLEHSPVGRRLALELFFLRWRRSLGWLVLTAAGLVAEAASFPLLAAAALAATNVKASVLWIDQASTGRLIAMFLGLVLARTLIRVAVARIESRIVAEVFLETRRALLSRFCGAAFDEQTARTDGPVVSVLVTSCGRLLPLLGSVGNALSGAMGAGVMVVAAAIVSWQIAIVAAATGLVLLATFRPLMRRARRDGSDLTDTAHRFFNELSHSIRVVREASALGVTEPAMEASVRAAQAASDAARRSVFTSRLTPNLYQSAVLGIAGLLLWLLANTDVASAAEMAAATLLLVRALGFGQAFQEATQQVDQGIAQLTDITGAYRRLRSSAPDVQELPHGFSLGALEFRAAGYRYPDGREGLRDVSLRVERHEIVGIVGRSGSGKSTLLDLAMGLREPSSGEVCILGDGSQVSPVWLRAAGRVGYVGQRPELLDGTIHENVAFYRPIADDVIVESLRRVQLEAEEVGDGPAGIRVGPAELSGGQIQRLAIARALAGGAELLVLDELTSALDEATEAALVRSLGELRGAATVLLVTHRRAPLSLCDRVYALDDGCVVDVFHDSAKSSTLLRFTESSGSQAEQTESDR